MFSETIKLVQEIYLHVNEMKNILDFANIEN